jgi:hypothetical protein
MLLIEFLYIALGASAGGQTPPITPAEEKEKDGDGDGDGDAINVILNVKKRSVSVTSITTH